MDEKTEELRDIFVDIADEDTVTERQSESRGSLTGETSTEGLAAIVAEMREVCGFDTSLDDEALVAVIERFYAGDSDGDIAEVLDVDQRTVVRARLDLHLLREDDTDAPFDFERFRELLAEDRTTGDIAETLGVSESTVRRYRHVVEAQDEHRRVSGRFRSEFEDLVATADLSQQLTTDVQDDGLEEATEGMETNVQF
ncbi:conditioned medium-induced protein 4 [Natronomonas sp. CBA1123]|jgi:DNA-directed RNA polymerase specialized sigma24 family protein|uniref:conditioned medium-induced protein 4 n=1 Tax=Natronomonas sp. CBA1123 TaxID=2668070 RepID=UPI0012EAA8F8|nr:conditioned medium-induced protein 4 [Natronomonas sp. CBA1123]MUV85701.1 conditioned medium-induced protein 4 [Natronomonas sp. CBA1123]